MSLQVLPLIWPMDLRHSKPTHCTPLGISLAVALGPDVCVLGDRLIYVTSGFIPDMTNGSMPLKTIFLLGSVWVTT